jgi:hypothetical protein
MRKLLLLAAPTGCKDPQFLLVRESATREWWSDTRIQGESASINHPFSMHFLVNFNLASKPRPGTKAIKAKS